ncbi:hypothetical protein BJY01DRAFT_240059 [Aspergillus pseudoustus]|uniref:GST N-terminal domain-containing protein n=1 Tax=Aspergillus pseudoustus TaxID=1810923 RepID=A0ABR4IV77_9EURO
MSDNPSANQDKLTLYSSTGSQWAYVAHLALIEKGYKSDEYDVVNVDLSKPPYVISVTAENLEPEYVKINPHGTIPSMNHPALETPLVDSVDILDYLDRSRPAATPLIPSDPTTKARVQQLIELVHSDQVGTNLILLQARSDEELDGKRISPWHTFLSNREATLEKYRAHEPNHPFYERRSAENGALLRLYTTKSTPEHAELFARTHSQYREFAAGVDRLESLLVLPYAAAPSVTAADLHIVPWLAHAMWGAGGEDIGDFAHLEELIQVSVPDFKVGERIKTWWANIGQRESFKQCYQSLH